MSYTIMTDTSANVPTPLAQEQGIIVVPLSYTAGAEEKICLDTDAFGYAAYYDSMKNGERITTSQINPQRYMEYMEPVLKEGKDILFVGMSSGISGSFNSAAIAKEQLADSYPDRKICLVDSHGASLGEGLLVLQAAQWQEQGREVKQAADDLTALREKMYQVFTVDDLLHSEDDMDRGTDLMAHICKKGTLCTVCGFCIDPCLFEFFLLFLIEMNLGI